MNVTYAVLLSSDDKGFAESPRVSVLSEEGSVRSQISGEAGKQETTSLEGRSWTMRAVGFGSRRNGECLHELKNVEINSYWKSSRRSRFGYIKKWGLSRWTYRIVLLRGALGLQEDNIKTTEQTSGITDE